MSANEIKSSDEFEKYFNYLKNISPAGRLYKRFVSSRILYSSARRFGKRIVEVGSGAGAGILGAFPSRVVGLEINPFAVKYSLSIGLQARLIENDGIFPVGDTAFDSCVLDNVLEHIENPHQILDECFRVTRPGGGMIIAVPGIRGFAHDADHKVYYDERRLRHLDSRWRLERLFSIPFFLTSPRLSTAIRQYCLVGVFKKARSS
jgi:SAM-dependent methyltransferase